jgi:protein gp37
MEKPSKIQWTDFTWNPWHGCKKVSAGCKYCYMFRDKERYGQDPTTVLRSKSKFDAPLKIEKSSLIFTCSWSDFFIAEADQWRDKVWAIIKATPQHTYQILTKRPERIKECLPADWGKGYDNVWLGVSVEDQAATQRIQYLFFQPVKIRFISCEPLLEKVDLTDTFYGSSLWNPLSGHLDLGGYDTGKIDWIIAGGESGNKEGNYRYRACSLTWLYQIINDGHKYDIPVFIKQLGSDLANWNHFKDRHGGNPEEWLNDLQIRQFPQNR